MEELVLVLKCRAANEGDRVRRQQSFLSLPPSLAGRRTERRQSYLNFIRSSLRRRRRRHRGKQRSRHHAKAKPPPLSKVAESEAERATLRNAKSILQLEGAWIDRGLLRTLAGRG